MIIRISSQDLTGIGAGGSFVLNMLRTNLYYRVYSLCNAHSAVFTRHDNGWMLVRSISPAILSLVWYRRHYSIKRRLFDEPKLKNIFLREIGSLSFGGTEFHRRIFSSEQWLYVVSANCAILATHVWFRPKEVERSTTPCTYLLGRLSLFGSH